MTSEQIILGVLAFAGTIVAGLIAARVGKAGSRENQLIDQLQEQVQLEAEARQRLEKRVDQMAAELASLRMERVQLAIIRDAAMVHIDSLEGQVVNLGGIPLARPRILPLTTPPTLD